MVCHRANRPGAGQEAKHVAQGSTASVRGTAYRIDVDRAAVGHKASKVNFGPALGDRCR
jgi:hypothetical protein